MKWFQTKSDYAPDYAPYETAILYSTFENVAPLHNNKHEWILKK